jgi:hypothetical protein
VASALTAFEKLLDPAKPRVTIRGRPPTLALESGLFRMLSNFTIAIPSDALEMADVLTA